jgi:hypothetical protein
VLAVLALLKLLIDTAPSGGEEARTCVWVVGNGGGRTADGKGEQGFHNLSRKIIQLPCACSAQRRAGDREELIKAQSGLA